jgi:hypothetical protein
MSGTRYAPSWQQASGTARMIENRVPVLQSRALSIGAILLGRVLHCEKLPSRLYLFAMVSDARATISAAPKRGRLTGAEAAAS